MSLTHTSISTSSHIYSKIQHASQVFSKSNSIDIVDVLLGATARIDNKDISTFDVDHSLVGSY